MRRTVILATAVFGLAVASACEPTGSPRCDAHADAVAVADQLGYVIDCTPTPDYPGHLGWTDHPHHLIDVWADHISTDAALHKVMWHEVGHAYAEVHHLTFPTQQAEECWADRFAAARMSTAERAGVGFLNC